MGTNSAHPPCRWIPWSIVAFFVFFMLLLSHFAWIAFHTYTGQVTQDAYKKGLTYNSEIARSEAQDRLGWKAVFSLTPQGNNVRISFALRNASGRPITDAEVTVRATRATQAGHDKQLVLESIGNGVYRGNIELAWSGAWDIRVSASRGTANFQQSKTIILQ